jgi:hypothetical protein
VVVQAVTTGVVQADSSLLVHSAFPVCTGLFPRCETGKQCFRLDFYVMQYGVILFLPYACYAILSLLAGQQSG